ncbi:hypothetical protein KJ359_003565 [Pestalotiopsis sp. 9143b]|nr:hypothetical protein KJ359_003565 [Pestalotiopsis sp. 9143b]
MGRFAPPDPRKVLPSRADPEHRSRRKELEKEHGYGYTEPLILAALGIGLIWNIEQQVEKREKRKDEEEQKEKEREERRKQRRENQIRAGTWQPGDERSDRGSSSRYNDYDYSRDGSSRRGRDEYRDEPRQSHRDDPRRADYRDYEYRGYRDQYNDYRNDTRYEDRRDGSLRRSSRRDSF